MASSAASIAVKLQKLSNQATEKSFKYNTQEANTARSWQKMMSDTSHQREVEDLKKAGLNPVLASNQGAQSYTTSSASDHAENASNAVASVYGSEMSADATKKAAAMSAQAMKVAAAQQAAAARYAAAMQYQTQKDSWKWKTDYMQKEYDRKEKLINVQPPKNASELVWKFTHGSGINDVVLTSKAASGLKNFVKTMLNNPADYFKDNVRITKSNFMNNINSTGINKFNVQLKQMGIRPTDRTRKLLGNYVLFRDLGSMNQLYSYMPKKPKSNNKSNNSAKKVESFHAQNTHGRMVMSNWF